ETRRLLLSDHDVSGTRCDHRDDLVAVDRIVGAAARLVAACALPPPAAGIPIIRAALTGRVDDRQPLGARPVDQRLDVFESHPGFLAAGGAPPLDRLEDGFRPLAAERPIDVDDEQCRPLAEPGAGAEPAGGEHRLVALGQKLVPDRLAHGPRSLSWGCPRSSGCVKRWLQPALLAQYCQARQV